MMIKNQVGIRSAFANYSEMVFILHPTQMNLHRPRMVQKRADNWYNGKTPENIPIIEKNGCLLPIAMQRPVCYIYL